jgi:low affinity Fe/Cu permease
MKNLFRVIANRISIWTGTASVFLGAIAIVVIWAFTGPLFHYSDTWQLVINTGTTIITFLMVFLIQNTQNRDGKAVQLKLDELIRATKGARTQYVGLEDLSDTDLTELDKEFKLLVQNPGTVRAINKLHAKIEAEHNRRSGIRDAASHMLHHTQTVVEPDKTAK